MREHFGILSLLINHEGLVGRTYHDRMAMTIQLTGILRLLGAKPTFRVVLIPSQDGFDELVGWFVGVREHIVVHELRCSIPPGLAPNPNLC